jgi:hypothetical protein
MSKPQLRIGVLTLSQGDERQLEPGALSTQLQALISQGTITYAAAPDDWVPFGDGKTILKHLQDGLDGFQLFSDSSDVARFKTRRKIKLFVIDPAVLLHPEKAKLAILIQEHVCSCTDKASCIVICGTLPLQFVRDLWEHHGVKLNDLLEETVGSLFEFRVDDVLRLKQFLRRITPFLGDVPVSPRFAEATRAIAHLIGGHLPPIGVPTIGIGAGG